MGFNLKSYECKKCGKVIFGEKNSIQHYCSKLDDNKLFSVHQIRTAAFYAKIDITQIDKIISSLSELFIREENVLNIEKSKELNEIKHISQKVDKRVDGLGC